MSNVSVQFKFASALVGALSGYQAGLYGFNDLACGVLWPASNLCSTPTVLAVVALGAIAGAVAGWHIANRFGANLIAFSRRDTWTRDVLVLAFAAAIGSWYMALLEGKGASFQSWYWLVVMPGMCAVAAGLGFQFPRHAWRWGAALLFGQWIWVIFTQGSQIGIGNLGPFAHVVVFAQYALSAIPCIIAAEIAAYWSRSRSAAAQS
ncbi:MAG: hypothetical protein WDO17_08820 [Alphaproteobacteria bacterium]